MIFSLNLLELSSHLQLIILIFSFFLFESGFCDLFEFDFLVWFLRKSSFGLVSHVSRSGY